MDPMLGTILLWPIPFAPVGYALCNGASLAVQQNAALFSLLGTRYGGDGQNTFKLPDLRNRVPRGLNNPTDATALGGSDVYTGTASGTVSVTLTTANLPAHSHPTTAGTLSISIPVSTDSSNNTDTPGPTTVLTKGIVSSGISSNPSKQYTTLAPTTNLLPFNAAIPAGNTGNAGTGTPLAAPVVVPLTIPTLPAYCPVNFIIAIQGIYPSRN
ncbi:phage tail protein [Pedobacter cryoconitis]|uniref:Microcystin-dependent protein n=1 Tax=Pedobacter cryoconitis TaxID=188932 RepID=A0A327RVH0_9SPHI|nr:tail fiber protein [Pedobacter cryoconitis]RAJ20052.1 microcystin-dependent protein [Pedobacter cryoconitis]